MPSIRKPKVIAIIGPTGSGKTDWAKKIAIKFGGKVISADSRQIYKGMDIGTGKDKSFKQDLVDIIEPFEKFSLYDYQKLANNLINQYMRMKALPILCGGTGLYLYAVLYGYILPGIKEESEKLRKKLEKLSEKELFERLKGLDPQAAKKIDPKNKRRLIRALEVVILSGSQFSIQQKKLKPKFNALIIGVKTDRETLYSKIDARVEQMIKNGLVKEVRGLITKYRSDLPALNTIGYKEIIDYLRGRFSLTEAIDTIKTNTHAYVRRQETWFRKNRDIKWVSRYEDAEKLVGRFLKRKP